MEDLRDLTPILGNPYFQRPFQDPRLEVPTIYKAYVREYPHKIWQPPTSSLRCDAPSCSHPSVTCKAVLRPWHGPAAVRTAHHQRCDSLPTARFPKGISVDSPSERNLWIKLINQILENTQDISCGVSWGPEHSKILLHNCFVLSLLWPWKTFQNEHVEKTTKKFSQTQGCALRQPLRPLVTLGKPSAGTSHSYLDKFMKPGCW